MEPINPGAQPKKFSRRRAGGIDLNESTPSNKRKKRLAHLTSPYATRQNKSWDPYSSSATSPPTTGKNKSWDPYSSAATSPPTTVLWKTLNLFSSPFTSSSSTGSEDFLITKEERKKLSRDLLNLQTEKEALSKKLLIAQEDNNKLKKENMDYRLALSRLNYFDEDGKPRNLKKPVKQNDDASGKKQNGAKMRKKNRKLKILAIEKLKEEQEGILAGKITGIPVSVSATTVRPKFKKPRCLPMKKCPSCDKGLPWYCLDKCGHAYCARCLIGLAKVETIDAVEEVECRRCNPTRKGKPILILYT